MRIIWLDCCCQWYRYLKWTWLLNVWWHVVSHVSLHPPPPPPTVSSANEDLQRANTTSPLCGTFFIYCFLTEGVSSWSSSGDHFVQFRFENTGCSLLKKGGKRGPEAPRPGKRWRFTWTSVNMWPDQLVYTVLEINTHPGCVTSCYTPDETVLLDHHIAIFKFFYLQKMPL